MSDLSHLADGYRERARWPDADRIAWIRKDRWLGFPKAEAVRKTLDTMLRYPPRTRMPCLLIYGQTGMGKSRIVERFEAENPRGFNEATGVWRRSRSWPSSFRRSRPTASFTARSWKSSAPASRRAGTPSVRAS